MYPITTENSDHDWIFQGTKLPRNKSSVISTENDESEDNSVPSKSIEIITWNVT